MAGAIVAIGPGEGAADEAIATTAALISAAQMAAGAEAAIVGTAPMASAYMRAAQIPMARIASTTGLERGAWISGSSADGNSGRKNEHGLTQH
jgi:hypothetical protein